MTGSWSAKRSGKSWTNAATQGEKAQMPLPLCARVEATRGHGRKSVAGIASTLSATLALKCPACIPALSALLSSLGVGFAFVRWILIGLLLAGVGSIAWAARLHARWWVLAHG